MSIVTRLGWSLFQCPKTALQPESSWALSVYWGVVRCGLTRGHKEPCSFPELAPWSDHEAVADEDY